MFEAGATFLNGTSTETGRKPTEGSIVGDHD
jgi:hypothetical protein